MLQIINFCKFNFTRSLRMSLKIKPQSTHLSILSLSPHASHPSSPEDKVEPHSAVCTLPSARCSFTQEPQSVWAVLCVGKHYRSRASIG